MKANELLLNPLIRLTRREFGICGGSTLAYLLASVEYARAFDEPAPDRGQQEESSKEDRRVSAGRNLSEERNSLRDRIGVEVRGPTYGPQSLTEVERVATGTAGNAPVYLRTEFSSYFSDDPNRSFHSDADSSLSDARHKIFGNDVNDPKRGSLEYSDRYLTPPLGSGTCSITRKDIGSNDSRGLGNAATKGSGSAMAAIKAQREYLDYLVSKMAEPKPSGPTIEAYRPPIVPYTPNPYPFDYPNEAAPPSDAPENGLPGPIPRGWTGAPEFQRGVIPPQYQPSGFPPPWLID